MRGVTHVFHLAVAMREGGKSDEFFERVNLEGTRRLLEAAGAARVERFVYCGTIGIYGHRAPGITTEASPLRPGNIYERTKVAAERMVRELAPSAQGAVHDPAAGGRVRAARPAAAQAVPGRERGAIPAVRRRRGPAAHGLRGRRRVGLLRRLRAAGRGRRGDDRRGAAALHPARADRRGPPGHGERALRPPAARSRRCWPPRRWSKTSARCCKLDPPIYRRRMDFFTSRLGVRYLAGPAGARLGRRGWSSTRACAGRPRTTGGRGR